jgi:hypothetical protein
VFAGFFATHTNFPALEQLNRPKATSRASTGPQSRVDGLQASKQVKQVEDRPLAVAA